MAEFSPAVILCLILLSVPLQMYLSPNSTSDANYYLSRLVSEVRNFYEYYAYTDFFEDDYDDDAYVNNFSTQIDEIIDEKLLEESKEDNSEMFGGSEVPRDPRPPHIKYHVGQVVRHKIHKYRAVIIGWDETAKAPEWWLKKVHENMTRYKDLPNYTVIIDTRNRLIPQIGYVAEENIVPDHNAIVHPLIKYYFEGFDGKCYKSRPWHRRVYPNG